MSNNRSIQVGDLVVMQHPTYFEEFDGCIGRVTGALCDRSSTDLRTMAPVVVFAYRIQLSETFTVNAEPHQVRLLADPDEEHDVEVEEELLSAT